MRQTVLRGVLSVSLLLISVWGARAAEAPVAVSPGDASKLVRVEFRCPTFSWGALPDAKSYELVVYRLRSEGDQEAPLIRKNISGSALSWTPSLDRCLERGGRYAWSVRAMGAKDESEWSQPNLFEVASGPSEVEFEAAVEVVQAYLAARDEEAAQAASSASLPKVGESVSGESSGASAAPAATQLSVDGNVDAMSFTGDGGNLGGVATDAELIAHGDDASAHHVLPTALPPSGAAGGDLAGTYPNPTVGENAVGSAEIIDSSVAVGDLAFDPATQTELGSHAFISDAHHGPPSSLPPSGAAGGDLAGTYPNPTVGADAVGSAEIENASIAVADLAFDPATQGELDAALASGSTGLAAVLLCDGVPGGWRYFDLGDGTVLDCNTRKIWLKDAGCLGFDTWGDTGDGATIFTKVADLNSGTDFNCSGYTAGTYSDWEVPAMTSMCGQWHGSCHDGRTDCCTESQGIVDTSFSDPVVANAEGTAQWSEGDAFVGVQSNFYWSTNEDDASHAFGVDLDDGAAWRVFKEVERWVWPVRGGQ